MVTDPTQPQSSPAVPLGRPKEFSADEWAALRRARLLLEHPSLAARLTSLVGVPVESAFKFVPPSWQQRVQASAEDVTRRVVDIAISTLPAQGQRAALLGDVNMNRWLAIGAGAAGGLLGLPGTLMELPFTTLLMLRAISATAAEHGEDLSQPETRLACCEVFALGGPQSADDAAETGYYSVRVALAVHLSAVSRELLERGMASRTLPAAVNLVRAIAARFGVVVSEKAAAQMVPIVGAAGGALLNAIFIEHFQDMARGHFTVRSLERRHGREIVEQAYARLGRRDAEAA